MVDRNPPGTHRFPEQDQAQGAADKAKEKGEQVRERTAQQAEEKREQTAEHLHQTSETIRERGQDLPGGDTTTRAASMAADSIDQASGYLRDHEVSDIVEDIQRFARNHPAESMIAAGVLGLLLGRAFRN